MRILRFLLVGSMILAYSHVARATPITSFGQPVVDIGSATSAVPDCPTLEGQSCFNTTTGKITFFIPLSSAYSGIFGVTPVSGGTAGTISDAGSGTGLNTESSALTMFLRFSPLASPAASASLTFNFLDLDLGGINDPSGFFESVRFFNVLGDAMSPFITTNGQSSEGSLFPFIVSGNSTYQTITFPDITSIIQDPFFAELRFNSQFNSTGTNTPEYLTATLTTSTPVPEPGTLLLLGLGFAGVAGAGRLRQKGEPSIRKYSGIAKRSL